MADLFPEKRRGLAQHNRGMKVPTGEVSPVSGGSVQP